MKGGPDASSNDHDHDDDDDALGSTQTQLDSPPLRRCCRCGFMRMRDDRRAQSWLAHAEGLVQQRTVRRDASDQTSQRGSECVRVGALGVRHAHQNQRLGRHGSLCEARRGEARHRCSKQAHKESPRPAPPSTPPKDQAMQRTCAGAGACQWQ